MTFLRRALVTAIFLGPMAAQHAAEHTAEGVAFDHTREHDLGGLVEFALLREPGTRAAWSRAQAAEAAVGQARAQYWPRIVAEFRGGSDQWYTPAAPGPDNYRRAQATILLGFELLLLDFGRRDADVARTLALLDAAGFAYLRRRQETVFAVQSAWFAHEAATWRVRAADALWNAARTNLETVRLERETGLLAAPDLLLAQKQEAEARFLKDRASNLVKISLGQLCTSAGLPADTPLRVRPSDSPPPTGAFRQSLAGLIGKALDERPDLAGRIALAAGSAQATREARADFLPEVRIEANYGLSAFGYRANSPKGGGTYNEDMHGYGAFLVASWELFDGFERASTLARRLREEDESKELVEQARLRTVGDVWSAYHEYLIAAMRVEAVEDWVRSARETAAAVTAGFETGLEERRTLDETTGLLARAEFELADAVASLSTSAAALALAVGAPAP